MKKKSSFLLSIIQASLLLAMCGGLQAAETYTVSIDGTDTWNNGITNYLDVTSTVSTENSAISLTADATLGNPDGTVSYDNSNANGNPEVNVRIADANEIDMKASFTWVIESSVFPLGIQDPTFTFRDIDANTRPGGSDEFCDRLEFRAFDINNSPIAASNFSYVGDDSAVVSSTGNVLAAEANANDTPGTGTATFSIDHNNVGRVEVIYEACEVDTDTDRPGAAGIVGMTAFSVATADLTIQKQWNEAVVNDSATVSVTGGSVSYPNLNSTANNANETDAGSTVEVIGGVDYTISEVLAGANQANYISSLSCTGTADDVSNGVLTPAETDTNIVCTYLNDRHRADIDVSKTDSTSDYTPGSNVSYTIVVTNNGPHDVSGMVVTDTLPAGISGVTWTCASSSGSSCPNAAGSGNVSETLNNVPNGGTVTYVVSGQYSADPTQY